MIGMLVKDIFGTEKGKQLLTYLKELSFRETPRAIENTNDYIYAEGRRSVIRDLESLLNSEEQTNE